MPHRILLILISPCCFSLAFSGNRLISIDHQLSNSLQGNNSHIVLDYLVESIALATPFVEYSLTYGLSQSNLDNEENSHLEDAVTAVITTYLATGILKYTVQRKRPNRKYQPHLWNTRITPSFPSGHVASSTLFATWIATYKPELSLPVFAYTLASAFSQVYVGNHYVGDVIGGALLGFLIGKTLFNRNKEHSDQYIETQKRYEPMFLTFIIPLPSHHR